MSDIESYFGAIATAQENVDRCTGMAQMQGRAVCQDKFLLGILLLTELRTRRPTRRPKKASRLY